MYKFSLTLLAQLISNQNILNNLKNTEKFSFLNKNQTKLLFSKYTLNK